MVYRRPESVILPPGEYLIVFASGKDRARPESELHTNFRLSARGEFLALTGPVRITRTQPVRAIVYKEGWKASDVVTHTYIFVDDVIRQDGEIVRKTYGFPTAWKSVSPDYGLNQSTVEANPSIREDLLRAFDSRGVYTVDVVPHRASLFTVDGYTKTEAYSGKYFADQRIEVMLPDVHDPASVVWRVNRKIVMGNPVRVDVSSATIIELDHAGNDV